MRLYDEIKSTIKLNNKCFSILRCEYIRGMIYAGIITGIIGEKEKNKLYREMEKGAGK